MARNGGWGRFLPPGDDTGPNLAPVPAVGRRKAALSPRGPAGRLACIFPFAPARSQKGGMPPCICLSFSKAFPFATRPNPWTGVSFCPLSFSLMPKSNPELINSPNARISPFLFCHSALNQTKGFLAEGPSKLHLPGITMKERKRKKRTKRKIKRERRHSHK